eukprot:COSAG05_NODE_302_length_11841_cov_253.738801_14_plen_81_part_00
MGDDCEAHSDQALQPSSHTIPHGPKGSVIHDLVYEPRYAYHNACCKNNKRPAVRLLSKKGTKTHLFTVYDSGTTCSIASA